jgi:hypothetical protein
MASQYHRKPVSTDGQTLDAQVAALTAAGAQKVYQEKVSGSRPRPDAPVCGVLHRPARSALCRALLVDLFVESHERAPREIVTRHPALRKAA